MMQITAPRPPASQPHALADSRGSAGCRRTRGILEGRFSRAPSQRNLPARARRRAPCRGGQRPAKGASAVGSRRKAGRKRAHRAAPLPSGSDDAVIGRPTGRRRKDLFVEEMAGLPRRAVEDHHPDPSSNEHDVGSQHHACQRPRLGRRRTSGTPNGPHYGVTSSMVRIPRQAGEVTGMVLAQTLSARVNLTFPHRPGPQKAKERTRSQPAPAGPARRGLR